MEIGIFSQNRPSVDASRYYKLLKTVDNRLKSLVELFFISVILLLFTYSYAEDNEKVIEISLTKGTFLIDSERYEEAIEVINKGLELRPSDNRLLLALGITYSRSGRYTEALEFLKKVLTLEPENCRARYELGLVFLGLHNSPEAEKNFKEVVERCPDEHIKDAVTKYLELLLVSRTESEKTAHLSLLTGIQYDTNVILEPSEPIIKRPKKSDQRSISVIDAGFEVLKTERLRLRAGYMFYQGLHRSLTDFNIHQHSANLKLDANINKGTKAFISYTIQYSLAGGDLYSVINTISPGIEFQTRGDLTTCLFYRHDFRKFFDSDTFQSNPLRSGGINAIGISERFMLWENGGITAEYSIETEDTERDYLDSLGHRVSIMFWRGLKDWSFYLKGEYLYKRYKGIEPGFSEKLKEGKQEYSLGIEKGIAKGISLSLSEVYILNDANISGYDYTRNITGAYVVLRF